MAETRVDYLIDNLLRAGTQTALLYLVEGLSARGYRQRIYCLNRRFDPGFVAQLEKAGCSVSILGISTFLNPIGWWSLVRSFRDTDIVQTFLPVSDILGRLFGKLAGKPKIVTSIRARNIDKRPWQLYLDRLTMRWADRVVFNAANVVDFSMLHEGVNRDQVVIIPNGVRYRAPEGRGKSIFGQKVPQDAVIIGTVGRLRPQKAVDILLEGFSRLAVDRVHLVIVGDGELRSELEEQASQLNLVDRVHFLGARNDLPEVYALIDIYVHTARFEGMPNAVMEAMAAGLPVVATAADGTTELITDGKNGWLVEVGDVDALVDKLEFVLSQPEERRAVGHAAAATMRESYSVEAMVERFDRLFSELAHSKDQA